MARKSNSLKSLGTTSTERRLFGLKFSKTLVKKNSYSLLQKNTIKPLNKVIIEYIITLDKSPNESIVIHQGGNLSKACGVFERLTTNDNEEHTKETDK